MAKDSIFNTVPVQKPPRTTFDLSHEVKQTMKMGTLTPVLAMEVLPGDSITIDPQSLIRMQPLAAPVMHKVKAQIHCFFVPNRVMWRSWQNWLVGQGAAKDYQHPYIQTQDKQVMFDNGSLGDYLGIPTGAKLDQLPINAFPVAAYAKIYNDWYRDETIQDYIIRNTDEEAIITDDGGQQLDLCDLALDQPLRRAWSRDYLTSCLPEPQKGDPVQVPLSTGTVPVELTNQTVRQLIVDDQGSPQSYDPLQSTGDGLAGKLPNETVPTWLDPNGTLTVDIQAEAVDIEVFRRAVVLQAFLETNARGGTRYIEHINAHFGVKSSDGRLQNAEYIGGISSDVILTEVLSTAGTQAADQTFPIGDMAGHGIAAMGGKNISYYAEEHGILMCIMNVQPKPAYQQSLHRMFIKQDKYDYAYPLFANLGEQPVYNYEVACIDGMTAAQFNQTFGYIPRYAELKFLNDRVAGQMRQEFASYVWSRIFETSPALNAEFIECRPSNTPFFFQDPDVDNIIVRVLLDIKATRCLPKYGVPKLVG